MAEGSSGRSTKLTLGYSALNSDDAPTLEASSIELNVPDSSADGADLSLTVGEDQARPDLRR